MTQNEMEISKLSEDLNEISIKTPKKVDKEKIIDEKKEVDEEKRIDEKKKGKN